jgi:hypothetical protein
VSVVYVEYDDTVARRRIDGLLEPTHDLCYGVLLLEQGEVIYVARELLADESVRTSITEFFRERVVSRAAPLDGDA